MPGRAAPTRWPAAMMKEISKQEVGHADQLGVDDEPLRRARLARADAPACRDARPDGQAFGRDHRAADHRQLQGGAVGPRILQLDPRRPQGPRGHRAQDGELRLPDPPAGGRRAGLHHRRGGLRHRPRPDRAGGDGRRRGRGQPVRARAGPHRGRGRDRSRQQRGAGPPQHADRGGARPSGSSGPASRR